jgi:hypothetical protein
MDHKFLLNKTVIFCAEHLAEIVFMDNIGPSFFRMDTKNLTKILITSTDCRLTAHIVSRRRIYWAGNNDGDDKQGDRMILFEKIAQNVANPHFIKIMNSTTHVKKVALQFGQLIKLPKEEKFAQSGHPGSK